ncbi:MAG: hypothetical protein ACE147_00700 [Candidatus Methylomirabilales bacterium]
MPETDGEFRGATREQINTLFHAVERVERGMEAHCREEKETWREFGIRLDAIQAQLVEMQRWRSRVVGYAAGISTGAGFVLHYLWDKVTK